MSQSRKDRCSRLGRFIRRQREQKAISREDLADDAKIWPRTLRDIELGKRTPQHRTLKKIALALDISIEMLSRATMETARDETTDRGGLHGQAVSASTPLKLIAARYIPLYTGMRSTISDSDGDIFRDETSREIVIHRFDGNFVVIELIDILEFTNAIKMLAARRERHLSILNKKLDFLNFGENDYDQILSGGSRKAEYVMSVHQLLDWDKHDEASIYAICEPSLVGITDDPDDLESENHHVDEWYFDINELSCDIDRVKFKNSCYYAGWSNVLLLDKNVVSSNFVELRNLEVQLQKLWFQIYIYDNAIDRALKQLNLSLRTRLIEYIYRLILDVYNFSRINSVGSWHINQLKRALVRTSQILELCEGLKTKVNVLKTLS